MEKRLGRRTDRIVLPESDGSSVDSGQYAEIDSSGLFDRKFYLEANPDVASAGLDPLEHYLQWGRREGRKPAKDFDPLAYLKANPDLKDNVEPFLHYVRRGHMTGRPRSPLESFCRKIGLDAKDIQVILEDPNVDPPILSAANDPEFWNNYTRIERSGLFNADFYRTALPVLKKDIDPIAHYMIWGYRSYLDPSANFSSAEYFALNPDVRNAGLNPLLHYILRGRQERRNTSNVERERTRCRTGAFAIGFNPSEEIALERMRGIAYHFRYGFSMAASSNLEHAEQAIRDLASRKPTFSISSKSPDVTIIIPTYGLLPFLLNCLDSLAAQSSRHTAEIIIVDDFSPAQTGLPSIVAIPWVRYLRQKRNEGFVASCNFGAAAARGRFLVFLNNDTRVLPGWLDHLIGSFELFPKAALIGSKLINEDGSLQEAGGIVWRDGSVWNYGRGEDPIRPEYCFARRVDYCSGASIAVSAEAWKRVGGFNSVYAPAYCEDTDLAFTLRGAGYETWLQPLSMVLHYEGRSHGRDVYGDIKAYQLLNLEKFYTRWNGALRVHGLPQPFPHVEADRSKRQHVLILDAQTPTPDRDAGSRITYEWMLMLIHEGWHVAFAPRNHLFAGNYTQALQRIGVEMLIAPHICNIRDIIENRPKSYDLIVAFRHESLTDCYDELRATYPTARMIFHDIDLHYLRLERKAKLFADRSLRIQAQIVQDKELELFAKVDCPVVVTEAEKATIESQIPIRNIIVFPYTTDIRRSDRPFEDRNHLCFIGGYAHDPNVDAVIYFVRNIWPLVKPKLPPESKFLIVGPDAPESVRSLATEDILVMGHVPQLSELLDECRLSVVPVRYGAGIKGKLVETLATGLPSVATTLAVEGMNLEDERQVLIADTAKAFARAIVRLFKNRALWYRLQEAGYGFAEENYSWKAGLEACNRILDVADETWIARRISARQNRLANILRSQKTVRVNFRSDRLNKEK